MMNRKCIQLWQSCKRNMKWTLIPFINSRTTRLLSQILIPHPASISHISPERVSLRGIIVILKYPVIVLIWSNKSYAMWGVSFQTVGGERRLNLWENRFHLPPICMFNTMLYGCFLHITMLSHALFQGCNWKDLSRWFSVEMHLFSWFFL